jgi:hypothetical protein
MNACGKGRRRDLSLSERRQSARIPHRFPLVMGRGIEIAQTEIRDQEMGSADDNDDRKDPPYEPGSFEKRGHEITGLRRVAFVRRLGSIL